MIHDGEMTLVKIGHKLIPVPVYTLTKLHIYLDPISISLFSATVQWLLPVTRLISGSGTERRGIILWGAIGQVHDHLCEARRQGVLNRLAPWWRYRIDSLDLLHCFESMVNFFGNHFRELGYEPGMYNVFFMLLSVHGDPTRLLNSSLPSLLWPCLSDSSTD